MMKMRHWWIFRLYTGQPDRKKYQMWWFTCTLQFGTWRLTVVIP